MNSSSLLGLSALGNNFFSGPIQLSIYPLFTSPRKICVLYPISTNFRIHLMQLIKYINRAGVSSEIALHSISIAENS